MANDDRTRIIPRRTPESAAMSANIKRAMAITGTLNRLTKLEMQRATLRTTKAARSRRATRASIRSTVLGANDAAAKNAGDRESQ